MEGKCTTMCPEAETRLREKEKLLHVLEMVKGTENSRCPKADRSRIVKSFSRSAAGKVIDADSLRPPSVLLKTVTYLLSDVINEKSLSWHKVYDFITDRLMAVRQDMVIQNISEVESIKILQPIIRFHAYASYRLCNESAINFDPFLNKNHLQECLKKLLKLYDSFDETSKRNNYLTQIRPEFEALYIVLNLGDEEALRRTLTLPHKYKTEINNVYQASAHIIRGNFVRGCRLIKKLPPLIAAVASLHLPKIRRKAFAIMSCAYNSKNLKFPLDVLKRILLHGEVSQLVEDCKYYGIMIDGDYVCFNKQSFNGDKKMVNPRQERFVESRLSSQSLQTIILQ